MTDDMDDPFLTIDEAAQLLRVSRRTLDNYRYRKQGPPYRRHGGRIVYPSAISSHGPSSAGRDIRKATRVPRQRLSTLTLLTVASLAILFPRSGAPVLVWNASPSVPIGLYRLTSGAPLTGALAVIRLPEPLRILADTRGYLRKGALLIKPVAAAAGDTVCRHSALVAINGRVVARASTLDAAGRSLPTWSGCFRLAADQIFVLSADPDSFDSRYLGPIDRAHIVGIAQPAWVRQAPPINASGPS